MIPRPGSRAHGLRPAGDRHEPAHASRSPLALTVATLLRDGGPLTVREIATRLSRSRGAISEAVVGLLELGVAREVGVVRPHQAGRPARSFDFCADDALVVGIEVGSEYLRVVAADVRGVVTVESVLARSGGGREDGEAIDVDELDRAFMSTGLSIDRIRAIGIGVAFRGCGRSRPVDPQAGKVASLEDRFDCRVLVNNAPRLAAVAEQNSGASSGIGDVLHISVRDEVVSTLVLGGRARGTRMADLWRNADELDDTARSLSTVVRAVDPALVVVAGATEHQLMLIAVMKSWLTVGADVPVVRAAFGDMAPAYGAAVSAFARFSADVNSYPALPAPRLAGTRDRS